MGKRGEAAIHECIVSGSERIEERSGIKKLIVDMVCPQCGKKRPAENSVIKRQIENNPEFDGICKNCSANKPRDYKIVLPDHPAIVGSQPIMMEVYGSVGPCIEVSCPDCKESRWIPYRNLKHDFSKENWTGACKSCWSKRPKDKKVRSKKNPSGRRVLKEGYIALSKNAISDEDLDMFFDMKSGNYVLEHRWNMAKHLGRPIQSYELIDHMDGNKQNNHVSNLRIYVRGKNQPGSCPGYGTYYSEWQESLSRLARIKNSLNSVPIF